jgi:colicin import membrane protein
MMNRTQKKCLFASAGIHSLLMLILVVGPAFLVPRNTQPEPMEILDILDATLVDAAVAGGGNPNVAPLPPAEVAPVQPPKQPEPKPEVKPEPTKQPEPAPPEKKRNPDSLEVAPEKKRTFDFKEAVRKPSQKTQAQIAAEKREREQSVAREKLARQLAQTANSIKPSSSTAVEAYGPGGGGEVYMSYDQFVRGVYWRAWEPPEDTASDDSIARATVTIASDGKVTFFRVTKPSGDAAVDRSVLRALERVKFVAPFPKGAKDRERTYNLNFNLKAKRLAG